MPPISDRLATLRRALLEAQLDAYLIPSTDPHQSEYVAPRWQARQYFSGFTGSAGTLVVTAHEAVLWTDGRYTLQAGAELAGSGIDYRITGTPDVQSYEDWLGEHLLDGQTVGVDGRVFSIAGAERLAAKLALHRLELSTEEDLVDRAWPDRPAAPARPVFEHTPDFSGQAWQERLSWLTEWTQDRGADYFLVSALDELAWLLNIRGSDIDYNPLAIAYLLVGRRGDHALFADAPDRFAAWQTGMPEGHRLDLAPYGKLAAHLRGLNADSQDIGLDPATASVHLGTAAGGDRAVHLASPIPLRKAVKNEVALGHLREALRHDGRALLKLRRWLGEALPRGITEKEVEHQLTKFRAEYEHYVTDSFAAIVGYAANGAVVDYHAPEEGSATLRPEGLLLLDSGGQYRNGTTDITRTFALGPPTAEQRRNFTLVLKGMIALSSAEFPVGTTGGQLDALARQFLWQHGLNYGHGTGHGVGYFLNVHEGPAGIHARIKARNAQVPLQPGMVFSNEPGYYKAGEYGIRIENLVVVVPAATEGFLKFETLTLFPIEEELIDDTLLTVAEREWIEEYHRRVEEEVGGENFSPFP